jgi:hypothetical protein
LQSDLQDEEEPMKFRIALPIAFAAGALVGTGASAIHAQTSLPDLQTNAPSSETAAPTLTPAQRRAIYAAVGNDKSKTANKPFAPAVGADVPPMLELYALPDQVLAENRAANAYEYTLVADKVVLVDPTRMRVVDVIGPPQ